MSRGRDEGREVAAPGGENLGRSDSGATTGLGPGDGGDGFLLAPGAAAADPGATGSWGPGQDPTASYVAGWGDGMKEEAGRADPGDGRLGDFAPGVELQGRYRLESELGRGGFGLVFLATDLRLGRPVAVKVMLPGRRASDPGRRERLEAMFADEARMAAGLHHPAIATIHDYGFHGPLPYMVFEFVAGESLRDRIRRRGRFALGEVVGFVELVAEGLDYAHVSRVVHRDLKPENIRITERGQFKVLDLGLARRFDLADDWRFAGTPAYASPEQASEVASDGRADQYALAVMAYEMLTGRRPFPDASPLRMLAMHRFEAPIHPRRLAADLPGRIGDVLLRALSKDPADRFPTCGAFAAALGGADGAGVEGEILLEGAARIRLPFLLEAGRSYLLLTPRALWSVRGDEVTEIPLDSLVGARRARIGRALFIRHRAGGARVRTRRYNFADAEECRRWHDQLAPFADASPRSGDGDPAATSLVPAVPYGKDLPAQVLCQVAAQAPDRRGCIAALQARAAMVGADAIVPDRLKLEDRERRVGEEVDPAGGSGGILVGVAGLLAEYAGEPGEEERSGTILYGVAVRASNRGDRMKLWTRTIRRKAPAIGWSMVAAAAGAAACGFRPNVLDALSTWGATVMYFAQTSREFSLLQMAQWLTPLAEITLLGLWPLCLGFALARRKSGRFLLPAAATFAAWAVGAPIRSMMRPAPVNIDAPDLSAHWWTVAIAIAMAIVSIPAWRYGLRYRRFALANAAGPDSGGRRGIDVSGTWLLTFLFILGTAGITRALMRMALGIV